MWFRLSMARSIFVLACL
uniref:Uncharacterized protein n=1 Tax=Anguilla anguilla TaxID=7936 RepID=A0A0E9SZE7_ANGAN